MPPAVSRLVLSAQEDLRREIARAMHDGPAQSLTNIVLQAQIVERLVAKDPTMAQGEVQPARGDGPADPRGHQDVHLRRPARWSSTTSGSCRRCGGRPASAASERGSPSSSTRTARTGACRWTSRAGCSGCSTRRWSPTSTASPDRMTLRLDWTPERVEAHMSATPRRQGARAPAPRRCRPTARTSRRRSRAMMEERRVAARDARRGGPQGGASWRCRRRTWREIQGRAATIGVHGRAPRGRRRTPPRGGRPGRRRGLSVGAAPSARGQGLVEYGLILALTARLHGDHPRRVRQHRRRRARRDRRPPSTRPPAARDGARPHSTGSGGVRYHLASVFR